MSTSVKNIKKELDSLKTRLIIGGKKPNNALNLAREAMNKKYGHGQREKELPKYGTSNQMMGYPSHYDGHENGEYWMD